MRSPEEVVYLYHRRYLDRGPLIQQMEKVRDAYNGDIAIPLPELSKAEAPSVPNLVAQGLDQTAMRIASTLPDLYYHPDRIGFKTHIETARRRRMVNLGWWDENNLALKIRRRARWMLGYACSPVLLKPSARTTSPCWYVRNPLSTYPAPLDDPDSITPRDCIFAYTRPVSYVAAVYGEQYANLRRTPYTSSDDRLTLIEYVDADQYTTILVSSRYSPPDPYVIDASTPYQSPQNTRATTQTDKLVGVNMFSVLHTAPNRTGICPAVVPGRITLDKDQGQYDGIVGMYQTMAMLFALETRAVIQGVWPDTWAVARPNENVEIITEADGRAGIIGKIQGGDIKDMVSNPGYMTNPTLDRLERYQRMGTSAPIPADFGGECVDSTTEILTANGWKQYSDLQVGEEVLTLNHETGMSEWQPVQKVNIFSGSQIMVEMDGPRFSALTTKNHRWPIVNRGERKWIDSTQFTSNTQVPIAALNADLPTEPKYADALVECVAWFYTEGSCSQSRGQISQSTKNAVHLSRIRQALTSLFGPPTNDPWRNLSGSGQGGVGHDGVPRWKERAPAANEVVKFELSAYATRVLTEQAPNKVPSTTFIRNLTSSQLELFIQVSLWADNCGASRFGQKDPARSDAFALACLLSGRGVSFQTRVRTDSRPEWPDHTAYIVRSRVRQYAKPKENVLRGNSTFGFKAYTGIVWCPTTPNGTWLARRKGSVYFTGNSASNVRTGRRGQDILSAAIDFPVQEAQTLFERSLVQENLRAIAIDKAYFGTMQKSYYISWPGARGQIDYTPNQLWSNDVHTVKYSVPGTDINNLTIITGQLRGLEMISRRTAMEMNPLIDDAESEQDRVNAEKVEDALWQLVQTQIAQGQMSPEDVSLLYNLVVTNRKDPADALMQVQAQAQQRQATTEGPVPPGSPPSQPGIGTPGGGAEAGTVQPPGPSLDNLRGLLSALRPGANLIRTGNPG